MTPLQANIARAIVNIFETGRLQGDYGRVTVAANDRGHLTYGSCAKRCSRRRASTACSAR